MNNFISALFNVIRAQLKTAIVQQIVFKIIGSIGGFRAFIIKQIVSHFYDEVADAVAEYGGYIYYKIDGEINFKKLEKAKKDNDEKAYDNAVNDIIG